jgi:very-short-patch-repair endonuclease
MDPEGAGAAAAEGFLASAAAALGVGIQTVFQVDERELASELVGADEQRAILLWEDAEGGLGVLRRLLADPTAVARVAATALAACHFDPATGEDLRPADGDDPCVRACYQCLLSYTNQPQHRILDRHSIRDWLMALASAVVDVEQAGHTRDEQYRYLYSRTDADSKLEREVLDLLNRTGRRLPDEAQYLVPGVDASADFFYREPPTCVMCDGAAHDGTDAQDRDRRQRAALRDAGYVVIAIRHDAVLREQIDASSSLFGRPADGGPDMARERRGRGMRPASGRAAPTGAPPLLALLPDRWRPLADGLQALGAPDPIDVYADVLVNGRVSGQRAVLVFRGGDGGLVALLDRTETGDQAPGSVVLREGAARTVSAAASDPAADVWESLRQILA